MLTNLWPSYEDLFDQAEEHALDMLLTQWKDLCDSEDSAFQKVCLFYYNAFFQCFSLLAGHHSAI